MCVHNAAASSRSNTLFPAALCSKSAAPLTALLSLSHAEGGLYLFLTTPTSTVGALQTSPVWGSLAPGAMLAI